MANYVQSSTDDLYPGLVATHPIYNSDMSLTLVAKGVELTDELIEKLAALTDTDGRIYVDTTTDKTMQKRRERLLNAPLTQKLEDSIGYTEIKEDTIAILERIAVGTANTATELAAVSQELSQTVNAAKPSIIVDLVSALASADEYLQRHCINVGMLNALIGKWLGMPKEALDTLILVGLLHDCGKASIPNKILSAPRPLTGVEFEVIKTHTVFTDKLMSDFPDTLRESASGHHEKINGRGYPKGLAGDSIPPMARITAISDIYDAMISRRSYKNPNSPFTILSAIGRLSGTELDAKMSSLFISNMLSELIGKRVDLSDGRQGTVISIDPDRIEYPTVDIDGTETITHSGLSCVSLHYGGGEDEDLAELADLII